MTKITNIKARQVFDSRGNPTVEAEIFSDDENSASAIVPSGASTGKHEAFELRDVDNKDYLGKSVLKSVENINSIKLNFKNIKSVRIMNMKKNRGHARCYAASLKFLTEKENFDYVILMDGDGEDILILVVSEQKSTLLI